MPVMSAGILLYRIAPRVDGFEVLIAHMGGPYWARKTEGAWSIPKGEFDPDVESALDAARREFVEELGVDAPDVEYAELGTFPYASGKRVVVFVGDGLGFAPATFTYGTFELEWPPRSGRTVEFPEVDDVRWTNADAAAALLVKGQRPALEALGRHLGQATQNG
ncbi:MAG: NUDIX domain-containing protein [Microbacterium sp.]|uniref:NUDIX domain-containing protein n=1 Tax=Microbacterium sp. TaxID=51671 RepID=UPI0027204DE2|nr:NUDIX domain-containing protein [Microbacterium sp.]MDO8384560.1 NUDIX domain-containing protein [Microbacterium sp.]